MTVKILGRGIEAFSHVLPKLLYKQYYFYKSLEGKKCWK